MYVKGFHVTTLDDILAATGTSKSQLYRHAPDKDALVHAVLLASTAHDVRPIEIALDLGLDHIKSYLTRS